MQPLCDVKNSFNTQIFARCLEQVVELAYRACKEPMPMKCIPPYPESSYPFGDLVPLGFLLKALKTAENDPFCEPAISQLTAFLLKKKQGKQLILINQI